MHIIRPFRASFHAGRRALRGAAFVFASLVAAPLAAQGGDTLDLPLASALRLAREGEEVGLATRRLDAATAAVGSAKAGGMPTVRLSSTFSHVYENARAQAVGQIFNQPNTYNTNATLSVPLFQGGRTRNATRAAASLRDAATADVVGAELDVSLQTLDAYLAAQLAEIGVMLLMFGVGLHFSLDDLMAVKHIAVPGAIVQIAVATGLGVPSWV